MSIHHRSGKAWRHHDSKRIKNKVSKYLTVKWQVGSLDKENLIKVIGKRSSCLKKCSCYMCGNPRKHFGQKTIKEKQSYKDWKEQVLNLD